MHPLLDGLARLLSVPAPALRPRVFDRGDEVAGVVYLDSTQVDFFNPEFQEEILGACFALVDYVKTRYT